MVPKGGVWRLKLVLALFLPALFMVLPAVAGASPLGLASALTAGLAVALVAAAVVVHLEPTTAAMRVRAISLRERAQLFTRLSDPDAPGRPRPRAPSTGSAAA